MCARALCIVWRLFFFRGKKKGLVLLMMMLFWLCERGV